jgi:hypothetical protein
LYNIYVKRKKGNKKHDLQAGSRNSF